MGAKGKEFVYSDEATELRFFQENIQELEHKGRDLYIGRCPACGQKELRVFETDPVEVRCESCTLWTFGVEEFTRKVLNKVASTVAGERGEAASGIGWCVVCGEQFTMSRYTKRKKEYCSTRCRKRAERQRKRGTNVTI